MLCEDAETAGHPGGTPRMGVSMDSISMDSLLAKLQAARAVVTRLPVPAVAGKGPVPGAGALTPAKPVDFASILAESVNRVDQAQRTAGSLAEQFQLGTAGISLEDTMVALQKANISFQAMVQVRNKVVAAYNEILNMQI
jgi:flagellar hook-basal body complex protein FliE